MNARSWTSWCSAAMLAATATAGDAASSSSENRSNPPAINYSFADSDLPTPKILKTVKPRALRDESEKKTPVAPIPMMAAERPTKVPEKPALVIERPWPAVEMPRLPSAAKMIEPAVPPPSMEMKTARVPMTPMVEPAVVMPHKVPVGRSIEPVGASLPTVDDHVKCVECLKALSGSPIEADRKAALVELGKLTAWKHMKTAYMIIRRVALTEYNTKMRSDAVRLLGESMMEHALAADTLKLSAQYDSDSAIRAAALAQLERLASLPPDRVLR